MKYEDFNTALNTLNGLSRSELEAANIIEQGNHEMWATFRRNPTRFFLMIDAATARRLFSLVDRKMHPPGGKVAA